jgi:hypothetical protein
MDLRSGDSIRAIRQHDRNCLSGGLSSVPGASLRDRADRMA